MVLFRMLVVLLLLCSGAVSAFHHEGQSVHSLVDVLANQETQVTKRGGFSGSQWFGTSGNSEGLDLYRTQEVLGTAEEGGGEAEHTLATSTLGLFKTPVSHNATQEGASIHIDPPGPLILHPGESIPLQAQVQDEEGFVQEKVVINWAISDYSVIISSTQGQNVILTAIMAGEVQITAFTDKLETTLYVEVREPSFFSQLIIVPQEISFFAGEQQEFQVFALDQYGDELDASSASWHIASGTGTLSTQTGKRTILSALEPGDLLLQASLQDKMATAQVQVLTAPPQLHRLQLTPTETIQLIEGQPITLTAVPLDQYGEPLDVPVRWSLLTENGELSSVTGEEVIFTALSAGEAVIQVEAQDITAKFHLAVTYIASGRVIGPDGEGVPGVTISFQDIFEPVQTGSDGRWQKSHVNEELVVTPHLEDYTFEPSSQRVTGMNMTVNFRAIPLPSRLVDLYIVPQEAEILLEEVQVLEAVGRDQYGNDYLVSPTWSVPADRGIFLQERGSVTAFQPLAVGVTEVQATVDELTAEATIHVSYAPSRLMDLLVDSSRSRLKAGERETLSIISKDQYGQLLEVAASWEIISGMGHLSRSHGETTEFISSEPGRVVIQATAEKISSTIILQVEPLTPTSMHISPSHFLLSYGSTQTMHISVYDQDGEEMVSDLSWDLQKGSAHIEVEGQSLYLTPTGFGAGILLIKAGRITEEVTYSVRGFSIGAVLNRWVLMEDVSANLYTGTFAFRYGLLELEGSLGYGRAALEERSHWDGIVSPLDLTQVEGGLRFYLSRESWEPFMRGRVNLTIGNWESYRLVGPEGNQERVNLTGEVSGLAVGLDAGIRIRLGRRLSLLLFGGYDQGWNTVEESTRDGQGEIVFRSSWEEEFGAATYGALIRFMF